MTRFKSRSDWSATLKFTLSRRQKALRPSLLTTDGLNSTKTSLRCFTKTSRGRKSRRRRPRCSTLWDKVYKRKSQCYLSKSNLTCMASTTLMRIKIRGTIHRNLRATTRSKTSSKLKEGIFSPEREGPVHSLSTTGNLNSLRSKRKGKKTDKI